MKIIFFLLLPLFLLADVKFASCVNDAEIKEFTLKAADAIEVELNISIVRNFESRIYEDDAALYALKNGIIKFTVVRKELFAQLGLSFGEMKEYGFEILSQKNDYVLLTQSRFFETFGKQKKTKLLKQLKNI